jgi:hypothetical protein
MEELSYLTRNGNATVWPILDGFLAAFPCVFNGNGEKELAIFRD